MSENRWTRMSKLVDIDLEAAKSQLQAFERDLAAAQQQLDSLAEYADQSENDINQPMEYASIQSLSRQKHFLDSLKNAMEQQTSSILNQQQHLETLRQKLLALYQKRESYVILATQEQQEQQALADKQEANFLDDLSNKPFDTEGF